MVSTVVLLRQVFSAPFQILDWNTEAHVELGAKAHTLLSNEHNKTEMKVV